MAGHVLAERDLQVLHAIASGATNREIARELHVSTHTVKHHATAVYRKLDARNRVQAVQRAHRLGLLV